MKLGRKRPSQCAACRAETHSGPCSRALSKYLLRPGGLPASQSSVDYTADAERVLVDILGNDVLGCCLIAAGYHITAVATGNAGDLFGPTLDQVEDDYSAIGGYVRGDPSTDQGCDEATAIAYWTSHGFANGTKLAGALSVDPSNQQEIQIATQLFENQLICMELPKLWVSPMPSAPGYVWDVAGDPVDTNGHAIMAAGFNPTGLTVDSWGLFGTLTWPAVATYCAASANGGLYVLLTPDIIAKATSKSPTGLDWAALQADFGELPA